MTQAQDIRRVLQKILLLFLIFLAALLIRLYDLTDLPLDFHPGRQLQSMLKARGMYFQTLPDAPEWQREIAAQQLLGAPTQEPEINEWVAAWLYRISGRENVYFPRLLSVIYWLVGGFGLFLLAKHLIGFRPAVFAILIYLFLPYGIIASRVFMPDPLMVMIMIWGWWAYLRWHQKPSWKWAVTAGVLCGLAIFVKLTAIFMVAGAILGLALAERRLSAYLRKSQFWTIGALSILPALVYNLLGIFVLKFIWPGDTTNRILLRTFLEPSYYLRWFNQLDEVFSWGLLLLAVAGLALITQPTLRAYLFSIWGGYLLFGVFFFYYFATHDYYHLPLIPVVALSTAAVVENLAGHIQQLWPKGYGRVVWVGISLTAVLICLWQVRTDLKRVNYRTEADFWAYLGQRLQGHSVLALTQDYNSRLAYWGWFTADYFLSSGDFQRRLVAGVDSDVKALFEEQVEGKDLFVITMLDELDKLPTLQNLLHPYPVFQQGDGFIIYQLKP